MACDKRQQTDSCAHTQCPFMHESDWQCIQIVGGYCEVGEDCVERCQFSFSSSVVTRFHAYRAFDDYCTVEEARITERVT